MKIKITLSILIVIVIVALISNPNEERHKEIIKAQLIAVIQSDRNNTHDENKKPTGAIIAIIDEMLIERLPVDNGLNALISTDNYLLFSITKLNRSGKSVVIGIGFFSNLYLFNTVEESNRFTL